MRTTVRLDDDLLAATKRRAAETGRTLTAVIEDALRQALGRADVSSSSVAPLPVVHGTTRPGVDLDDSAGLLELMDRG
ncbi:MAG: CopG family transcriptional regulator [Acidimicrobiia bacterium]|nr:CopG family transcriptional regulator [Acidimicrobiia bacterium]